MILLFDCGSWLRVHWSIVDHCRRIIWFVCFCSVGVSYGIVPWFVVGFCCFFRMLFFVYHRVSSLLSVIIGVAWFAGIGYLLGIRVSSWYKVCYFFYSGFGCRLGVISDA